MDMTLPATSSGPGMLAGSAAGAEGLAGLVPAGLPAAGGGGAQPPASGGEGPDLLAFAHGLFVEAAGHLAAAIAGTREEGAAMPRAASTAARDLTAAFHTVMAERNRIDGIRAKTDGIAGGETLDLDAARLEIRSRLARLRGAL